MINTQTETRDKEDEKFERLLTAYRTQVETTTLLAEQQLVLHSNQVIIQQQYTEALEALRDAVVSMDVSNTNTQQNLERVAATFNEYFEIGSKPVRDIARRFTELEALIQEIPTTVNAHREEILALIELRFEELARLIESVKERVDC